MARESGPFISIDVCEYVHNPWPIRDAEMAQAECFAIKKKLKFDEIDILREAHKGRSRRFGASTLFHCGSDASFGKHVAICPNLVVAVKRESVQSLQWAPNEKLYLCVRQVIDGALVDGVDKYIAIVLELCDPDVRLVEIIQDRRPLH